MINRRAMIATSAAAIVGGGGWLLSRFQPGSGLLPGPANAQEAEAEGEMEAAGTVEITDMILGDPDAPVELIEYASFTCPHCANFHANQFKELKREFIDTGRIRFVYREVFFDRPGLWASMIARCGGQERFFGIANLLYERQGDWARSENANEMVDKLMAIGRTAGVSQEDLDACMQDADKAQALVNWYENNREEHSINSTPSLVIDGETNSNMVYADLAEMLEERLAAADG